MCCLHTTSELSIVLEGYIQPNAGAMSRLPCKQCVYHSDCESEAPSCNQIGQDQSLLLAQKNDNDLQKLRAWVEEGSFPGVKKISSENHFLKSLVSQLDRLCIKDNLLCRKWEDMSSNRTLYQYVVPFSERRTVLAQYHDEKHHDISVLRKHCPRFAVGTSGQVYSEMCVSI